MMKMETTLFPLTPGLYGAIRDRVLLSSVSAELDSRIGRKCFSEVWNAEFPPAHEKFIGGIIGSGTSLSTPLPTIRRKLEVMYVFGVIDILESGIKEDGPYIRFGLSGGRIREYLFGFSDKIMEQVRLSTSEGYQPSKLYYAWLEAMVYEGAFSLENGYKKLTVGDIWEAMTCIAIQGRLLAGMFVNDKLEQHRDIINEFNLDFLNQSTINRARIIYENLEVLLRKLKVSRDGKVFIRGLELGVLKEVDAQYDPKLGILGLGTFVSSILDIHKHTNNLIHKKIDQVMESFTDSILG